MAARNFSFAEHAASFDDHISSSIPGYGQLLAKAVGLSRRFIQNGTTVVDIGCTTGKLLRALRAENQPSRPNTDYIGIDLERTFRSCWAGQRAKNLRFVVEDARIHQFDRLSYACSLFTLQFMHLPDKLPLLRRIYDGMLEGGALLIAEKVLASSARLQDALTFPFYDFKLRTFDERHVLDKERSLRGQMTLWTEAELRAALRQVGFRELEAVWGDFPFLAILALK